jgi:hypothetical protein
MTRLTLPNQKEKEITNQSITEMHLGQVVLLTPTAAYIVYTNYYVILASYSFYFFSRDQLGNAYDYIVGMEPW